MLEYYLEQGAVEDQIIKQAAKSGQPLPDRIENAPSIWPGLELYYLGFLDLTSSRQMGFGPGPIPWGVIAEYCKFKDLDEDQTEAMHHHIVGLDVVYLKHQNKKK